jgi:hypothetical protein
MHESDGISVFTLDEQARSDMMDIAVYDNDDSRIETGWYKKQIHLTP